MRRDGLYREDFGAKPEGRIFPPVSAPGHMISVGAPCLNWGKGCKCEDCTFPGAAPYIETAITQRPQESIALFPSPRAWMTYYVIVALFFAGGLWNLWAWIPCAALAIYEGHREGWLDT